MSFPFLLQRQSQTLHYHLIPSFSWVVLKLYLQPQCHIPFYYLPAIFSIFLVYILQSFQCITGTNYLNAHYCLACPKLLQASVTWSQPSLFSVATIQRLLLEWYILFVYIFLFQLAFFPRWCSPVVFQRSVLWPVFSKTTSAMEQWISEYY